MEYEIAIGLEVHAQLLTKTKIFCSCSTKFGAEPNSQVCPVCLGMPGVLPVLNKRVVEFGIQTSLAIGADIAPYCIFARKNYFYPDLPKNYQISQFELPLATGGYVDIGDKDDYRRIRVKRIHMEEDAGKLLHEIAGTITENSYVDLNRTGVPLLEIVSEPDITSPEDAKLYLQKLKLILQYVEVCDGNMEEGSLRCDANISIRPLGDRTLGVKVEVKNLNSFRHVQRALEYEAKRQEKVLAEGGTMVQETRLWDPASEMTVPMRSKEESHDYRYFPEPDLVPVYIDQEWIEKLRGTLPELPDEKMYRLVEKWGIPLYDASVLTSSKQLAAYFEQAVAIYDKPKVVSNWIMGEILRKLKDTDCSIEDCPVTPSLLVELLTMIDSGEISGKIAKVVFDEMYDVGGKNPHKIVEEKGLLQIKDESTLEKVVEEVLCENPDAVTSYKEGKQKLFGFLVGQVMKKTRGKANPQLVNELLHQRLNAA